MSELWQLVIDWWPVFLLIYLPHFVQLVMGVWILAVRYRLDRDMPDVLPYTAGEWLERTLTALNLSRPVEVVVTDSDSPISIDGYHPRHGLIQLTEETYFKRDPVFWAVAGHELGHAMIRDRHPVLLGALNAADWLKRILASVGVALMVGNVLYGLPEVTELAFACIGAAMVLDVLTLIEEALASAVADGLLGKESAFTREHRRAGRLFLASAFMTYLAAFLSHLILLTYWSWLVELIGDGLFTEVAASPTGWRAVALGLATAILLAHAVLVVTRLLAPRQRTERPSLDRATSPSLTPIPVVHSR